MIGNLLQVQFRLMSAGNVTCLIRVFIATFHTSAVMQHPPLDPMHRALFDFNMKLNARCYFIWAANCDTFHQRDDQGTTVRSGFEKNKLNNRTG